MQISGGKSLGLFQGHSEPGLRPISSVFDAGNQTHAARNKLPDSSKHAPGGATAAGGL